MATIVKVRDKRSGILYAYSSVSYWNKEKKQGRSHRKLLGRVDENTGEIVPTSSRRSRPPKSGPVAKRQLSKIPASDKEGQANDQKLRSAKEKANVSAPSKLLM